MYRIRPHWRVAPTLPYSSVSRWLTVAPASPWISVSQSGPLQAAAHRKGPWAGATAGPSPTAHPLPVGSLATPGRGTGRWVGSASTVWGGALRHLLESVQHVEAVGLILQRRALAELLHQGPTVHSPVGPFGEVHLGREGWLGGEKPGRAHGGLPVLPGRDPKPRPAEPGMALLAWHSHRRASHGPHLLCATSTQLGAESGAGASPWLAARELSPAGGRTAETPGRAWKGCTG